MYVLRLGFAQRDPSPSGRHIYVFVIEGGLNCEMNSEKITVKDLLVNKRRRRSNRSQYALLLTGLGNPGVNSMGSGRSFLKTK
jgi:hypothetical protein